MMSRRAIVNIFSSYNNILMTATDLTGAETITTCSGGQMVKSSKAVSYTHLRAHETRN